VWSLPQGTRLTPCNAVPPLILTVKDNNGWWPTFAEATVNGDAAPEAGIQSRDAQANCIGSRGLPPRTTRRSKFKIERSGESARRREVKAIPTMGNRNLRSRGRTSGTLETRPELQHRNRPETLNRRVIMPDCVVQEGNPTAHRTGIGFCGTVPLRLQDHDTNAVAAGFCHHVALDR
jgi:hypothetical protein